MRAKPGKGGRLERNLPRGDGKEMPSPVLGWIVLFLKKREDGLTVWVLFHSFHFLYLYSPLILFLRRVFLIT